MSGTRLPLRLEFDEPSGVYGFSFDYFLFWAFEGELVLRVNGVEVATTTIGSTGHGHWWHRARGTATFEGIELREGDVVEVSGNFPPWNHPFISSRSLDFDAEELFDSPALGAELIENGDFEDHGVLDHVTRKGAWGILDNDELAGWLPRP